MCLERPLRGLRVMGKEAWRSSSGRRKRKTRLMRAPRGTMTAPSCPAGAVTNMWSVVTPPFPHCPLVLVATPAPFMSSVCFQLHLLSGWGPLGPTWEPSISPKPHLSPWERRAANVLAPSTLVRLWAGGGPEEETLGAQKETGDIPRKSQAEQTALEPEAYLNCVCAITELRVKTCVQVLGSPSVYLSAEIVSFSNFRCPKKNRKTKC